MATALPASVFVVAEHLERMAAGTGTLPPARLLVVGVVVQFAVGLLCLALVRLTFRAAERAIRSVARSPLTMAGLRDGAHAFGGVFPVRLSRPMASSAAGRAPPVPTAPS